jgi:hypothetical protein
LLISFANLNVLVVEFIGFLNGLNNDSIDRAIACVQEAIHSRKVLIPHFDPGRAHISCHSILRMTEKGSIAMGTVCNIPKFWVNLDGLVQASNLNSIESTITRVFCMQGALKFHYWLQNIIPTAIRRTSNPDHIPKTWIDKLTTDVRSSISKGGSATFSSADYLPNLGFPLAYDMAPIPFQFDVTDQLISIISSILRMWLRFPAEIDYLAQVTLLDIFTTNSLPSILFLDRTWEMYKTPFSAVFNNNWNLRRSKRGLIKALESFRKEFSLHPFAKTDSLSQEKLLLLSELIRKWMHFSGVDSDTAELVSGIYNHLSVRICIYDIFFHSSLRTQLNPQPVLILIMRNR